MASSDDKVLRYNSHGRKYEVPRKLVSSLDDLKSGDHIAFHRTGGSYWHHAIVDDVDKRGEKLVLIEYSNTSSQFLKEKRRESPKNLAKAEVVRGEYPFVEVTAVHLMLHECCYPADTVVENARSKIGEKSTTLSPITANTLPCGVRQEDHLPTKLTRLLKWSLKISPQRLQAQEFEQR